MAGEQMGSYRDGWNHAMEEALEEINRLRAALELGRIFMSEQTDENAAKFKAALKIK